MVDFVLKGDSGADGKQIIICMYVYHCVNVCVHTYVYVCVYIGIAAHPDGTRVYVADRGNDRVAVFNLDGACLSLIGSGTGKAPGFLQVRVCLSGVCMYTYIYKITYIYAYYIYQFVYTYMHVLRSYWHRLLQHARLYAGIYVYTCI